MPNPGCINRRGQAPRDGQWVVVGQRRNVHVPVPTEAQPSTSYGPNPQSSLNVL